MAIKECLLIMILPIDRAGTFGTSSCPMSDANMHIFKEVYLKTRVPLIIIIIIQGGLSIFKEVYLYARVSPNRSQLRFRQKISLRIIELIEILRVVDNTREAHEFHWLLVNTAPRITAMNAPLNIRKHVQYHNPTCSRALATTTSIPQRVEWYDPQPPSCCDRLRHRGTLWRFPSGMKSECHRYNPRGIPFLL